jgi:2-dehydro-3-deoxygalactonokinase
VSAFLACDWGTTNLRAWVLDAGGAVRASRDFPLGVSKLARGQAQRLFHDEVRPALAAERLPALLCGMIGSTLGWTAAPYIACPATLAGIVEALCAVDEDVRIVPGLRCEGIAGAPDVMRGEETQIFGWLHADPARLRGTHLVCHPGTHAKWAWIEEGRIVRFVTAMTGELFDVLRKHSVLRADTDREDEASFEAGLAAAGQGDALSARLFSARARAVACGADAATTASYLSGMLIGSETASMLKLFSHRGPVVLIGEPSLCARYAPALARHRVEITAFDGEAAARAGLCAIQFGGKP